MMSRRMFISRLWTVAGPWAVAGLAQGPLGFAESAPPAGPPTFDQLQSLNPHLSPDDPREFPMKLRSIAEDEEAFYRGTAELFYAYCRQRRQEWGLDAFEPVWLHGDIHIGNIGAYPGDGPPGQDIRFGLVDLDEAIQGPFVLDLLRGATAVRLAVAGRRGAALSEGEATAMVRTLLAGYLRALAEPPDSPTPAGRHAAVAKLLRKAAEGSADKYLLGFVTAGCPPSFRAARVRNQEVKDLMEPVDADVRATIVDAVWSYVVRGCPGPTRAGFRFNSREELATSVRDVARWTRIDSRGSQGVRKYLVLLERPLKDFDGGLILQLKEEPVPAAARAGLLESAGGPERAGHVARAYQVLMDSPEWLAGHTAIGDRGFLVRTKNAWNEELEADDILKKGTTAETLELADLLGETVGAGHRRALDRTTGAGQSVERIRSQLDGNERKITLQSAELEQHIRQQFRRLSLDPRLEAAVQQANDHIARTSAGQ